MPFSTASTSLPSRRGAAHAGQYGSAARHGRGCAQATLDTSFTRDKFVFVPGDIIFLEAGVIEDEDNPDGFVDATEAWWALQVTRPHERSRTTYERAACGVAKLGLLDVGEARVRQPLHLRQQEVVDELARDRRSR